MLSGGDDAGSSGNFGGPPHLTRGGRRVHFSAIPMKARVHVSLKRGVLDPQGKAIGNALTSLGFSGIGVVRQGKLIELELAESDPIRARAAVEAMCETLLANPVIEEYAIELCGPDAP